MTTELESRDREIIARLAEIGAGPGGALGLTFRLAAVDRLPYPELARVLGVTEATVASRISKVRAKLLGKQDEHARSQATAPDLDEGDPLTEAARHLLEAVRNREGEDTPENPATCGPLVNLGDARGIISEAALRRAAAYCPTVPPCGVCPACWAARQRECLAVLKDEDRPHVPVIRGAARGF